MRVERITNPSDEAVIDAIVALEQDSFTNPWPRDTLVWELTHSDVTWVYVLRAETGVVAFCSCWVIFEELHINTLAVAPGSRRHGHGSALMREVMREAAAAGAVKATLEVRESNTAALGLYGRLGFAVTARRRDYYTHPQEDALILWRDLHG